MPDCHEHCECTLTPIESCPCCDAILDTPPNSVLLTLVQHSESPDEHFEDDDERPW